MVVLFSLVVGTAWFFIVGLYLGFCFIFYQWYTLELNWFVIRVLLLLVAGLSFWGASVIETIKP